MINGSQVDLRIRKSTNQGLVTVLVDFDVRGESIKSVRFNFIDGSCRVEEPTSLAIHKKHKHLFSALLRRISDGPFVLNYSEADRSRYDLAFRELKGWHDLENAVERYFLGL